MHYVVIRIDDDKVAEQFAADMSTSTSEGSPFVPQEGTIVGLFRGPTKFCDPSDGHRGRKTEAGWTKGKKYGWWVCGKCKKPSRQWGMSLGAVLGAAVNLLQLQQQPTPAASTHTPERPFQ